MVPVNTPVNLVDQTTKVGWSRGTLYLERQAPLEGTEDPAHLDPAELDRAVAAATAGLDVTIDWDTARQAFQQASGVPVPIGRRNYSRPPAPAPAADEEVARDEVEAPASPAKPAPARLDLTLPTATDVFRQ
jgi:L,D-transpeptidase ErfK/SrfK